MSAEITTADPRYVQYSTLADNPENALLAIDYDSLPTYPIRPSYKDNPATGNIETHLVQFDGCKNDPFRPSSMPIYQTATFQQESIEHFGPYDYTRSGNPTRTACEQLVASLEGAHAAFAFSTGMAAITAVTRLLKTGDEILCADDIYGGAFRLFSRISSTQGISTRFVDTTVVSKIVDAISPQTRMIYLESPSNPLVRITDIRAVAQICKERNLMFAVDSTMMSPYLMNPLLLGADVCIHSGTKFLAGHSDTMAGFVVCRDENFSKKIAFVQNAEGTALAPFDTWLVLRGIKTLALRQDKQQETTMKIARFLSTHPLVKALYYAGLAGVNPETGAKGIGAIGGCKAAPRGISHQSVALHLSQARGGSSVLSFETGSVALSRAICDFTKLFKITVSFGSVTSLIEMPCVLSHASIPKDMRSLPDDLIRISIGIENVEDLIADLAMGFKLAYAKVKASCCSTDSHSPSVTCASPKAGSCSGSDVGATTDATNSADKLPKLSPSSLNIPVVPRDANKDACSEIAEKLNNFEF